MARPSDPQARDRVLDAADRLLARVGYRRMTIALVATEAGVGKGSVYLHVTSKEDLALSCIDRMVKRLLLRLEREAARATPAVARLRAMLVLRVMHRFDAARAHAASLDDLLRDVRTPLFTRRRAWFAREAAILSGVIRQGQREGGLAAGPPATLARALVDATNALLPASLSVREMGRRSELECQARTIADLLIRGLGRSAVSGRRPITPRRTHP